MPSHPVSLRTILWIKACNTKFLTLMMKAIRSSETSASIYQTTHCYISEDNHLHTHSHENLMSHKVTKYSFISVMPWQTFSNRRWPLPFSSQLLLTTMFMIMHRDARKGVCFTDYIVLYCFSNTCSWNRSGKNLDLLVFTSTMLI
jgi:hypothetical protein